MKTNLANRLSVRVKFKSFDQIELCIIDSNTGEIQLEEIPVTLGKDFPKTKPEQTEVKEVTTVKDGAQQTPSEQPDQQEKKGEDSSNDTNSNEDGGTKGK